MFNREFNARRAFLASHFDVKNKMEELEESCIPSYLHKNKLAAWVAWKRLVCAKNLYLKFGKPGKVLDFGAGSGELSYLLRGKISSYSFAELENDLSDFILKEYPESRKIDLDKNEGDKYDTIFALDSLEHNDSYEDLLGSLADKLVLGGALILSGPSENWLYRLGRKVAGFDGHYHHTTITDIETAAAKHLTLSKKQWVPYNVPLFSLSVWKK